MGVPTIAPAAADRTVCSAAASRPDSPLSKNGVAPVVVPADPVPDDDEVPEPLPESDWMKASAFTITTFMLPAGSTAVAE